MLQMQVVFALLHFVVSASAQSTSLLADGTGFGSGSLSDSVKWQSSGILREGGCLPTADISPCFTASLDATGQRLPRNRQRIELLSWPPAEEGERWAYDWSYFLVPGAFSSRHFFHITQLFSRDLSGFILALSLYNDTVRIFDSLNDCRETDCPSIALKDFEGRTTRHHMEAEFGSHGSVMYTVTDHSSNSTLFCYSINGTLPAAASIKTGLYRLIHQNQTEATAHLGNFSFTKTS